jgi:hypothetical protein
MAGGGVQFKMQCLDCGKTGPAIAHAKLTALDRMTAPAVDGEIRERYWEQRRIERAAEWEAQRNGQLGEWWERYAEYMASPEWAIKRRRVLMRDGHKCQACLDATATQVHHLTYRHLGNEPLYELISVCAPCHERITGMDRANGGHT